MTDNLVDTALKQAAACAREKYAGEDRRIDKGLLIALNNRVRYEPEHGTQVQSDSDPEVWYLVADGRCDCADWRNAPGGRCKHRYAVFMWRVAHAALALHKTDR